jgi:hypothetical protein
MVSPSLSDRSPSQVCVVNSFFAFYDIMEERKRCYSILPWTPHGEFCCYFRKPEYLRRISEMPLLSLQEYSVSDMHDWRPIGAVVWRTSIAQKVTGSIRPAQYKHLCAWTYLFVLGLGVFIYNIYKKKSI